jgi:peroxiredoxin
MVKEVLYINKDQAAKKLDGFIKNRQIKSEVILLSTANMNEWIKSVNNGWDGAIPAMVIRKNGLKPFFQVSSTNYPDLEKLLNNYTRMAAQGSETPPKVENSLNLPTLPQNQPPQVVQQTKNNDIPIITPTTTPTKPQNNSSYTIGDVANNFTLKDYNGKQVSLSDYKAGKGVIIIFQCNHCPYSQLYEQRIIDLHKKFNPLGFPVIAINPSDPNIVPEESPEEMKIRATQKKYPFVYLIDSEYAVAPIFGARRTPHVFVLDNNFTIQYIGAIDDNPEAPNAATNRFVENAVNALLRGELPNPNYTRAVGCIIKTFKRK